MYPQRRNFIKTGLAVCSLLLTAASGLLTPILARAARNTGAFTAETHADALAQLFPGQSITPSTEIGIDVHDVIENGAFVPVNIHTGLEDVRSISVLADKNPNPLIAKFNLAPECNGYIATRIKVAEPSHIIAVVEAGDKLYSASKFVEVVAGGCG